jgi:hypothetical protein
MADDATAPLTADDGEELRLLYQVSVADIAFFKKQQWSATNYAMGAYAALLIIVHQWLLSPLKSWQVWPLIVLGWAICIAGYAVVSRLQNSILGRRTRLERVRARFGKAFNEAWSIPKPQDDMYWLLYAFMFVGAVIATWLVLARA